MPIKQRFPTTAEWSIRTILPRSTTLRTRLNPHMLPGRSQSDPKISQLTAQYQEEAAAMVLGLAFFGKGMCRMANAATAVNSAMNALA
jgi:hypothetical protein